MKENNETQGAEEEQVEEFWCWLEEMELPSTAIEKTSADAGLWIKNQEAVF